MAFTEEYINPLDLVGMTVGLASGISVAIVSEKSTGGTEKENYEFTHAVLGRYRKFDPEFILDQFHNAATGSLMLFIQLFWPIFIRHDEVSNRVFDLKDYCDRLSIERQGYTRWNRVRVLPATAAIHAIGISTDEEILREFNELVFKIHQSALEEEQSRRMMETIWQTMTNALTRNRHNWGWFRIHKDLVDHAVEVCSRFLGIGKKNGEKVLLRAALAAWQFLLSYERALKLRKDSSHLSEVQGALNRIRQLNTKDFSWFAMLERLYEDRHTYDSMLPQLSEVIIQYKNTGILHRDFVAADFCTLVRLQMIYNNERVQSGKLHSIYSEEEDGGIAGKIAEESRTFLAKCGIEKDDWPRLKFVATQNHLFSEDVHLYLDHIFADYEHFFHQSNAEMQDVVWRAGWYPYRRLDELAAFQEFRKNKSRKSIQERISRIPPTADELIGLWIEIADSTIEKEIKRRELKGYLKKDILGEVEAKLKKRGEEGRSIADDFVPELEYVQEQVRSSSKTATTVSQGGAELSSGRGIVKERVMPYEKAPLKECFADKETEIAWETTLAAEAIAAEMPPEDVCLELAPIMFASEDEPRGLRVIFAVGTVIGGHPKALLVPERSRKILDAMNIPYEIVQ